MNDEIPTPTASLPVARKKILLKLLLGAIAVLAVFSGIVAMQPEEFRVARTVTISAVPEKIFPHVNNLHAWEEWSPFEHLDPAMKRTYTGPEEGVQASYAWSGNSQAGEGKMTIVESHASDLVKMKLEFTRPFVCSNDVEFTFLKPTENETNVSWVMTGKNNFIGKAFSLLMSMDSMVGSDFEKGLKTLKSVVEKESK